MTTDTQAPEHEPILDISTIAPERPAVRIRTAKDPDGTLYELKLLAEFGIADQQSLVRDGQAFDTLFNKDVLTGNERKRLKQILDRMFEKVLIADAKVKLLCNDHVRSQVVTAFTVAPLVMAAAQAETETGLEDLETETETEPEDDETSTTES